MIRHRWRLASGRLGGVGSVAELTRVTVTGGELNVLLRGVSRTNAVLLYLAGGPRGSEFGAMRRHRAELEQDFVVATLDQRGAGSSYDQLEPLVTRSLANAVTDVIEASDYCAPGLPNSRCTLWGSRGEASSACWQPSSARAVRRVRRGRADGGRHRD